MNNLRDRIRQGEIDQLRADLAEAREAFLTFWQLEYGDVPYPEARTEMTCLIANYRAKLSKEAK